VTALLRPPPARCALRRLRCHRIAARRPPCVWRPHPCHRSAPTLRGPAPASIRRPSRARRCLPA
jgi:hypothetical protein